MKSLNKDRALDFFISKYKHFKRDGKYFQDENEESLYAITVCEKDYLLKFDQNLFKFGEKSFPQIDELAERKDELTTKVYSFIYEK